MPNIILQDLTATIHNTSRFNGNQFDLVHVETLLQTNETLSPEANWYVPNGTSIKPEIAELFRAMNVSMYPMSEKKILDGTEDILTQSQENNVEETEKDATMYLLRALMKKSNLELVVGTNNLYHVYYDYKLFPMKDNSNAFQFKVQLPFDGFDGIEPGGQIKLSALLPLDATVDPEATKGIAIGGQELQEFISDLAVGRQMICFQYQNDPDFTIQYNY